MPDKWPLFSGVQTQQENLSEVNESAQKQESKQVNCDAVDDLLILIARLIAQAHLRATPSSTSERSRLPKGEQPPRCSLDNTQKITDR